MDTDRIRNILQQVAIIQRARADYARVQMINEVCRLAKEAGLLVCDVEGKWALTYEDKTLLIKLHLDNVVLETLLRGVEGVVASRSITFYFDPDTGVLRVPGSQEEPGVELALNIWHCFDKPVRCGR